MSNSVSLGRVAGRVPITVDALHLPEARMGHFQKSGHWLQAVEVMCLLLGFLVSPVITVEARKLEHH